jgi:hypothetical protein
MNRFEAMHAHQELNEVALSRTACLCADIQEERRAMVFDMEQAHKHFMDSLR